MAKNKLDTYSVEQKIGVKIYDFNREGKIIYFSKLVDIFNGEISRSTISKALDKLTDLCMINADWEEIDHKWVRSLHVSEGEYARYFQLLSNNLKDDASVRTTNSELTETATNNSIED